MGSQPRPTHPLVACHRNCIGCGASANWCQAHHIIHWIDGGPTNLDNMCLLCNRCHHKVHDDGWQVGEPPTGKYSLGPPPTHHMPPPRPRNHPYRGRKQRK